MKVSLVLALSMVLGGCRLDGSTSAAGGLSIAVNESAMSHGVGGGTVSVPYVVHNHSSTSLVVAACEGVPLVEVDRLDGESWTVHPGLECDGEREDVSIGPTAVVVGAVSVSAVPGVYRLRILFGSAGNPSGQRQATSETFEYQPFLMDGPLMMD